MPSWYDYPGYIFAGIAIAAVLLRDRWLAMTASLLCADCIVTNWLSISTILPAESQWAYKAILDLSLALVLAWPMRARGVVIASLVGLSVNGDILIGAGHAFVSANTLSYIVYYTWWGMEYLAFGICLTLIAIGIDDHGGKAIRADIADHLHRYRRDLLESHHAYRPPSSCRLDGEAGVKP